MLLKDCIDDVLGSEDQLHLLLRVAERSGVTVWVEEVSNPVFVLREGPAIFRTMRVVRAIDWCMGGNDE